MVRPPTPETPARAPQLKLSGICKRFPGVQALADIDFEVYPGEVHALVGENGAGKSTLMHILAGVIRPDRGRIDFGPHQNLVIPDELAAQRLGLAIVFQERSLFAGLSVAENIFAGRQPTNFWGGVARKAMEMRARHLLDEVGMRHVHPQMPLEWLSPHEQQLVEIAKALSLQAQLIIFDEPTAALTKTETDALFGIIARLKEQGRSIVYISHRLEEVFHIADRVTVLKDGRWQCTTAIGDTTPSQLISRMVGRELVHQAPPTAVERPGRTPVLSVRKLSDFSSKHVRRPRLSDIDLDVSAGEIVALAGMAGAGRTETALAIFGVRNGVQGEVLMHGRPVRIRSVRDAIRAGIGYLPEDRKAAGLFLELTIAENLVAASLRRFGRVWLSKRQILRTAVDFAQRLNISAPSVQQRVVNLSGGNQQKILLAKWLLVRPAVLIVDEPTRGVDVGAKAEVHRLLRELAGEETAVVLISSELPEVLSLADRVLVMAEGRITGELTRKEATEEKIIHLASQVSMAGA